jgi:uncharacterized caspase-like protein
MLCGETVRLLFRAAICSLAGAGLTLALMLQLAQAATAQPRVALVVGVGAYQAAPALANPGNDAADIGAALSRLGFQTETVIDPDRATLEQAVRRFGARARGADAALFFFAGHALEAMGRNWLLPRTAELASDRDLRFEAMDADGVLEQVEGAARVTIVLLDACRDNPFRARLGGVTRSSGERGLAPLRAATGTLIAFATAPGTVAEDGRGRNSPFTAALLKHIEEPGIELRQMMAEVRRDVRTTTGGRQIPWEHSSLEGAFYFRPPAAPTAPAAAPRVVAADPDMLFWESVRGSRDPADLRAYLERFPQGTFAVLARNRLAQLGAPATGTAPAAGQTGRPMAQAAGTAPTPQTPSAAAIAGSSAAAAAYEARLLAVLARGSGPDVPVPGTRREAVAQFVAAAGSKALAFEPTGGGLYRRTRRPAPAEAEQLALEGCAIQYARPCVLIAVDDEIRVASARGRLVREMPRVRHAGRFVPEQVPMTTAGFMPSSVAGYAVRPAPKALVLAASPPSFFVRGGTTTAEAEAAALADCAAQPAEGGTPPRCRVYALDDRVVLPEGRPQPARPASPPR